MIANGRDIKRQQFNGNGKIGADYRGAKSSRYQIKRSGIPSMGASADWHYKNDGQYLRLAEYARDIDRNDIVTGQILDRVTDNEVQGGFTLNCMTGDPKLDRDLEQRWREEADDPDKCCVTGERTFHDIEWLIARESKVAGDVFALPVIGENGPAIQIVENYRCRAPNRTKRNIVHGIELNDVRTPLRYYFTRDTIDPNSQVRLMDLQSIEARAEPDELTGKRFKNVWHVMFQKRATQQRGVTALAPIFDVIGIHDDVQYSKLVQQQITSFFAFIRERELAWQPPDDGDDTVEGLRTTQDVYGQDQEELTPGMEMTGLPGEKLRLDSANIPNPEWFPHVKLLLTFIGINLGAPFVMAMMDASGSNFHGYRGEIDMARLGFRMNQRRRIKSFYRPAWNWRLRGWLDDDDVLRRRFLSNRRRVNLFNHQWTPPSWPYIEPTKDALGDLIRESNTLISPRRRAAERGDDYSEIVREAIEDRANGISLAIEAANEINTQHGLDGLESVTWQHLYQPPMPQGVTLQLNAVGDVEQAGNSDGITDED